MAGLADLVVKIGADLRDFNNGMDSVGQKLSGAGKSMQKTGAILTAAVTAPIVAFGASAVKSSADFQTGMNRVQALTGASTDQFAALKEEASRLGATTAFSASEAADAMGFLAMAGFDSDQILGSMNDTLNLAAAAQMDLGSAADTVSNIMTGYGLATSETGHATDVLVKAMTSANTDLAQLGEAMKYAGPVASGVGVSFEEAAAAIGLMGNAGIQGSMAGTSLRGAIARLASPTSNAVGLLETLAARAGITGVNMEDMAKKVGSGVGPFGDMASTVDFLTQSGATAGEMMELFGQRAGPAMQALVSQGSGALRDLTADLEDSGGTAKRIADVQMSGFNGAMASLRSAFEAVQIAIGESGLLDFVSDIANGLAEFLRSVADLNPNLLKWGTIIAGVVAAIGPLIAIIGTVLVVLPQLIAGIGIVSGALASLSISGGPIFLTVAAIAALVAGIVALYSNWDSVTAFMQGAWLTMKLRIMGGITELLKGMSSLFDWIPGAESLFSGAIAKMEQKTGQAAVALADFNLKRAEQEVATREATAAEEEAAAAAQETEEALDEVGEAHNTTAQKVEGHTAKLREHAGAIREVKDLNNLTATSIGKVGLAHENATPLIEETTDALGRTVTKVGQFGPEVLRGTTAVEDLAQTGEKSIGRLEAAMIQMRVSLSGPGGLLDAFSSGGLRGAIDSIKGGLKDLAVTAFPALGPAFKIASGLMKAFGIDTQEVFNSIADGITNIVSGIGKKIAGLFSGFRKESEKEAAMSRFLTSVSTAGIDVTNLDAAAKSKLKQLMVAPMAQGVSQESLLSALGLTEADIARTREEALTQLVAQTGTATTTALDKFAIILAQMAQTDLVKQLGLAAGTNIIAPLEQMLGVSVSEAQARLAQLQANAAAASTAANTEQTLGESGVLKNQDDTQQAAEQQRLERDIAEAVQLLEFVGDASQDNAQRLETLINGLFRGEDLRRLQDVSQNIESRLVDLVGQIGGVAEYDPIVSEIASIVSAIDEMQAWSIDGEYTREMAQQISKILSPEQMLEVYEQVRDQQMELIDAMSANTSAVTASAVASAGASDAQDAMTTTATRQTIVVNLDGRTLAESTARNLPEIVEVIAR